MRRAVLGRPPGLWERMLDLVFPPRCVACGGFGSFLCEPCLAATPRPMPPRCPLCWMPSQGAHGPCRRCRERVPHFQGARSAFLYQAAAREAVHALKYGGVSALALTMAGPMAECLEEWGPPVSAVVPVPLVGSRRRLRGYNQAEMLARALARLAGLPVVPRALVRCKASAPQARSPDEATRRANVEGAFAAGSRAVRGGILLVDDVMTSGATLDACARALVEAGMGPVFALTFARED